MSPRSSKRRPVVRSSRALAVAAAAIALGSLVVWAVYAAWLDPTRGLRALLIQFMFFTPLAGGMVVWPAVVLVSRGRWMAGAERSALAGVVMAPVSLAALIVLAATGPLWAPWTTETTPQGAWLSGAALFGRDVASLLVFWVLAVLFVHRRRNGERPVRLAGFLTLAYCLVMSLLGADLIMALDPHWYSSAFPPYVFVTGLYAAVVAWALATVLQQRPPPRDQLHDLAKLIVAFSMLSTYLMFAQLYAIWFENLPDDSRFLIFRYNVSPWVQISKALLATVYLGPVALLLPRRAKRSRAYLGGYAVVLLAALWMERWWLIVPTPYQSPDRSTLALIFGVPEAVLAVAFAAGFVLAHNEVARRLQVEMPIGGETVP